MCWEQESTENWISQLKICHSDVVSAPSKQQRHTAVLGEVLQRNYPGILNLEYINSKFSIGGESKEGEALKANVFSLFKASTDGNGEPQRTAILFCFALFFSRWSSDLRHVFRQQLNSGPGASLMSSNITGKKNFSTQGYSRKGINLSLKASHLSQYL